MWQLLGKMARLSRSSVCNSALQTPPLRHLQADLTPSPYHLCTTRLWGPHRSPHPLQKLQLRQLWNSRQSRRAAPQTAQLLGRQEQRSLTRALQSRPLGQKQPRTGRLQARLLCRCLISSLQTSFLPLLRGIKTGWRARIGVRLMAAWRLKRLRSTMGCRSTTLLTSHRRSKSTKLGCSLKILISLKRRLVGLMHHMASMKVAQQRQLSTAMSGTLGSTMQQVSTQCLAGRVIRHPALSSTAVKPCRIKTRAWPGKDPRQLAVGVRMAAMLSIRAQHSTVCSSSLHKHTCRQQQYLPQGLSSKVDRMHGRLSRGGCPQMLMQVEADFNAQVLLFTAVVQPL